MNSQYTRLFAAYTISSTGDWLYKLAIPLFIYQITHSALSMSIAYGLTFLPYIVVTPFGGVVADRISRRHLLVWGDFAACGLTALLGIFTSFGFAVDFWGLAVIYFLIFLVASITSLYHPAFQSYLPDIVVKEKLPKANSLITSIDNMFMFLGPLLGGAIITIIGIHNAIFVNAISYLISACLIRKISVSETIQPHRFTIKSILCDLKEGFNCVWSNETIKFGCMIFLIANFGIQIFYANFMYFLIHDLALSAQQVGLTVALTGIGAIAGSLVAPKFIARFNDGRLIITCLTLSGLMTFLLLYATNFWQIALVWGCVSASNSVVIVTYFTLRQRAVAREMLGRTIAITRLISYTAIPIAAISGGWLIQNTHSMFVVILLSGISLTVSGLAGWLTPLNRTEIKSQILTG